MSNNHYPNPYTRTAFKGVKMTTAQWTINPREQQDLMKRGCLPVWGGDAQTPPMM
jgi:hypothetical protein